MAVYLLVALLPLSMAATDPQADQRNKWMTIPSGTNTYMYTPEASLLSDAPIGHTSLHKTSDWDEGSASTDLNTHSSMMLPFPNSDPIKEHTCSHPWFYPNNGSNGSVVCECGSELGGVVKCNNETKELQVLLCYCMTYNVLSDTYFVGTCIYACFSTYNTLYSVPSRVNGTELNAFMCGGNAHFHREGQLCGECEGEHAPPAYSYSLSCVECSTYAKNWVKYIAVAFLPLTLLFGVFIVMRISATSGLLNSFVFVAQTISMPVQMKVIAAHANLDEQYISSTIILLTNFVLSLYGFWNLDFFRMVYEPFCLHPKMTTIQALSMDYIIAIYPLALLGLVYVFVELHDRGCRLILCLWRPFHYCFSRFRRQWDIRTSLVDAFATFLLLSYMKLLSVSIDLLAPTIVYDIHGKPLPKVYLYYDGSTEYFGRQHLPFGIIALLMLLIFTLSPLLLLCLYSCRCCHKCLSKFGLRCQALHTFMDSFQGCYKNGTDGTRDCRFFAAVYVFMRIVLLGTFALTRSGFYYPLATVTLALLGISVAFFQPYKSTAHNKIDSFLIFSLVINYTSRMAQLTTYGHQTLQIVSFVMIRSSVLVPFFYVIGLLVYWLVVRKRLPQKLFHKLRCQNSREAEFQSMEDSLPDRIVHAEAYTSFIPAPILGDSHRHYSDDESGERCDRDAAN